MTLMEALLNLLLGLAGNGISELVIRRHQQSLDEVAGRKDALKNALASRRTLREEIAAACVQLAQHRAQISDAPRNDALWRVLASDSFQNDLAEWISRAAPDEGAQARERLSQTMRAALSDTSAPGQDLSFLETRYFEVLERLIAANPVIARWRHQLTLDFLREQVAVLRERAEEASGNYSAARKHAAIESYCDKTLKAWDIIDLTNLPEGDIQLATQKLLLRQLYMPLRLHVEGSGDQSGNDLSLATLEEMRNARRLAEAGRAHGTSGSRSEKSRQSAGERLKVAQRLVVLGDPGGGKTTLLRWMATAFLLRYRDDDAARQLPDIDTLPDKKWLPILIRCRDLGDADLCRSFPDFLTQHLYKTELQPADAEVMRAVVLTAIARGDAILLIDGLDEISHPLVRMKFCQEIERTAARYPDVPLVVTSRIVGYRDMPYRMGNGFEHAAIADLTHDDKRQFAERWTEVTEQHQPEHERLKRKQDLIGALQASRRIQQLTGNPMLLTTLALVKRKVGKLPSRRTKLYQEAISVLLNFNPLHETIDEAEAIPQLEYVAYDMCLHGVQRLTEDDLLTLLDRVRRDYPNVRAIRRREPEVFLRLLEARSSILIKSGGAWSEKTGSEHAIWEFRHLTFQEYLASRALIDGRYPDRDRSVPLAEQVSRLAAPKVIHDGATSGAELQLSESWQETLRMLVVDCNDDDVDAVLEAIATPLADEDGSQTAYPRLMLAALCLADEPNASNSTAASVLQRFADEGARFEEAFEFDKAGPGIAIELDSTPWGDLLRRCLVRTYLTCRPPARQPVANTFIGSLTHVRELRTSPALWRAEIIRRAENLAAALAAADDERAVAAMLIAMQTAFEYERTARVFDRSIPDLCRVLERGPALCHAAAWTLVSIVGGWLSRTENSRTMIVLTTPQLEVVTAALARAEPIETWTRNCLIHILGHHAYRPATDLLMAELTASNGETGPAAALALERIGTERAEAALVQALEFSKGEQLYNIVETLGARRARDAVPSLFAALLRTKSDIKRPGPTHFYIRFDGPDDDVLTSILRALHKIGRVQDTAVLRQMLHERPPDTPEVRVAAAVALDLLGDASSSADVRKFLRATDRELRILAVEFLACTEDEATHYLLTSDLNGMLPFIDPQNRITVDRIRHAALKLQRTESAVREQYEALAEKYALQF